MLQERIRSQNVYI